MPINGFEPESLVYQLDAGDTSGDVIDVLALEAFATGRQPYARSRPLAASSALVLAAVVVAATTIRRL
jgi:Domain of unknown function (DUF5925)